MLYRKTYTKPMPPGAQVFIRKGERFARYTDGRGRTKTAKLTTNESGVDRLLLTSPYWRLRYRNGMGIEDDVPTGCKDEVAAQGFANNLLRRAELVKAGTVKPAEDAAADHQGTPIAPHFDAYVDHLRAKGNDSRRIGMVRSRLDRLASECGFGRLCDLSAVGLEKWLVARQTENMSAATRNGYREAIVGFGNWCRRTHRLIANPFLDVPIADAKADRRHQRRALTEDELSRLLTVARLRPLAEFGRDKAKVTPDPENPKRSNWSRLPLAFDTIQQATARARLALGKRPDFIAELEAVGHERALIYKALVLTGLRKGELASITVGQLDLDAEVPYLILEAADEKNRHGSELPMRDDLAQDIRAWLGDRLKAMQDAARLKIGEPIPMKLAGDLPVFNIPSGLIRILDRDLQAAGISKRDDRNRVVDIHAMRTTFGTHLSKGGVAPRTAQAAMRHSDIKLTMGVYTDPKLLDVRGALDVLPDLPLGDMPQAQRAKATGTDGPALASALAPQSGKMSARAGMSDHQAGSGIGGQGRGGSAVSGYSANENSSQSTCDHEPGEKRVKGVEPSTFTLAT